MKSPAIFVLALVLFGCGKAVPSESDAKPTVAVELSKVTRRPMRQILDLSGSVVAAQGSSAKLTPAVAGRIAEVFVVEGQKVHAGELLFTLDTHVQLAQQGSAAAALQAAAAQAEQSQLALKAATSEQMASLESARINLKVTMAETQDAVNQGALIYEAARADLAKTRAGARPQEIAQAHEASVQAIASRDKAASEYRRNQELWPSGYVSRRQLEDAKTSLDTAESALKAAQATESLVKEGARPEEIKAQEAHTAAARDALETARNIGTQKVAAARSALKQALAAEANVEVKRKDVAASQALQRQKQADLSAANATQELGQIRAPYDGVISRRALNPGDSADTTSTVLEISRDRGQSDFVATALPNQASLVVAGMSVQVEVGTQTLRGEVASLTTPDSQTGLTSVRISISGKAPLGAFGTAHIVLTKTPNALVVEDSALLDRDGKTIVFLDSDGAAKQTEVKTGPEDGGFTAITSGLKEGDQVVKLGGNELDDGSKITIAEPKKGGDEDDKG